MSEEEKYIQQDLDVQVMTGEDVEDPCVYIKISGFFDVEDADNYADELVEKLPLLLFQSEQIH